MSLKKKITRAVAITLLVFLCEMPAHAIVSGVIEGNNVNVRAAENTSSDVIGKLNYGVEVVINGMSDEWYNISYEGSQAYISSQYVSIKSVIGVITGNSVNVRKSAATDADILVSMGSGDSIAITGQTGEWYQISLNGGQAYVHKNFVSGNFLEYVPQVAASQASASVTGYYAIVTSNTGLKLRVEPSTESTSLMVLAYDTVVDVLEITDTWVKVQTDGGVVGYVSAEFVSVREGEKPSRGNSSSKGEQIIVYAKQFIGTPYKWAGTDLNSGVDCSGFVYCVYKNFGITLNRSSSGMVSNGVSVSKDQLQTGDLVFFDTTGSNDGQISHVGIYISNGDYIHSSSGKAWGVTISNLNENYSANTYVSACRVLR